MEIRRKQERRTYERRTCVLCVGQERRSGFDRRQILRREDDRAEKRRRGFWRYQRRQRFVKDMLLRSQKLKNLKPYSATRVLCARQQALAIVANNNGLSVLNKNRLAREMALLRNMSVTDPPAHVWSTWHTQSQEEGEANSRGMRNQHQL